MYGVIKVSLLWSLFLLPIQYLGDICRITHLIISIGSRGLEDLKRSFSAILQWGSTAK